MKQLKLLLLSMTLLLSACAPLQPGTPAPATTTSPTVPSNPLVNSQWELATFGITGAETPVVGNKPITLSFKADGQLAGSGGCNSFGGHYQIQGNTLAFSQIISTKMACVAQGVTEQEQHYFQALEAAGPFEVTADHLTIHTNNGQDALNFVPTASPTATVQATPAVTATVGPTTTLMPVEPPERVQFAPGATTAQLASLLPSGPGMKQYVLAASARQTMTVDVRSDGVPLSLTLEDPTGMRTIPEMMPVTGGYRIGHTMTLPETGDYRVTLGKGDHTPSTNYTITFTITTPSATTEQPLAGTKWFLASLGAPGTETAVTTSTITIEFTANGQVTGNSGCNSYGGTYTAQNNTLTFDQLISTLKACTDEQVMQTEQQYLAALKTADSFAVTGSQLTIQADQGKTVLTFTSAVATASTMPVSMAATVPQPTVHFVLDPSLASTYTLQIMPAAPALQDVPYWAIYPAYTALTLTNYLLTDSLHTPQIFIYPTRAYAAMNKAAATQIAALQALLQARPPQAATRLPVLPLFNAAQMFNAQHKYVDFANGTGVRFLTQYGQAVMPINNQELFYTFQGLTADNAYYIAAIFPVTSPALPADAAANPPDFAQNFDRYLATTTAQLNKADAASFTPDLTRLDALIASLTLQPTKAVAPTPVATAQPGPVVNDRSEPTALLASYIDAINRKEYARAYGYWATPPNNQSLAQFTQGFADTAAVDLLVNPPARQEGAAGSVYASIPTVLVATHTDHIRYLFSGCYVVRRSNQSNGKPPEANPWQLYQGTLKAAAADSNLLSLLQQACPDAPQQGAYNNLGTPVDLLASFVDALNRQDYRRAYMYWETPPAQQTFDQFAQGYANTKAVFLTIHLPAQYDAGAGQQYAALPTWLVATHTDGTKPNFIGCYVAHRPNPDIPGAPKSGEWHLTRATVRALPNGADPVALLQQACATP